MRRRSQTAAAAGAVYTLLTTMAGAAVALDAGHDGPQLFLRLPISPFSLVWPRSVAGPVWNYTAATLFVIGLFFWSYVGWLLAQPTGGWALGIALGSHYLGVIVLLLTDRVELSEITKVSGVELFLGIPYVLGQVLLWGFLLVKSYARKQAV